jgi:hypothetical protein
MPVRQRHSPPSSRFAAHIHASVGSPRNTGHAPLELIFHEASHVRASPDTSRA